ncbi:MAG: YicC/YloC family endoribonuclease [Bacteroidota bacterium]
MILSMTGYGKSECHFKDKIITTEIRTLNSKNLDMNLKLPSSYKEKENVIRNMVGRYLTRGKAEIIISLETSGEQTGYRINRPLLKYYYQEISDISQEIDAPMPASDIFAQILRLPDMLLAPHEKLSNEEWNTIEKSIKIALENLDEFRKSEGKHLENDILNREITIRKLINQISVFEKERIKLVKDKIYLAFHEVQEKNHADENRFEQELIFYLEKLDITEEMVRLKKHLDYFRETINDECNTGKKLGFIAQEIGREINTIGSKANHAGIQKIVVQMKDELEKIKEQLMNIL